MEMMFTKQVFNIWLGNPIAMCGIRRGQDLLRHKPR